VKQAPWLLAEVGELAAGDTIALDAAESRHAKGALRLSEGRNVVLTDGAGRVAKGTLSLLQRGRAEVTIDSVMVESPLDGGLKLAIGVLSGSAMDLVVQKAVELGIDRLVPVCCQRSQLGVKRASSRLDHWTRIARQALKQCRRAWALEIAEPLPLADFVTMMGKNHGVVAHPEGCRVEAIEVGRPAALLVGPEGGLTTEEQEFLETHQWPRLRLGPYVLRAETAAIAGMAVLSHRMDAEIGVHSSDG